MPSPPHIVIACSYLHVPGGYEKAVVTTANLFAEKGLKVTLLILDETAESYYPVHKSITIIQVPLNFGITRKGNKLTRKIKLYSDIRRLRKILKKLQPSVVVCSEYPFAVAAVLGGVRKFTKIVSWEHHHFYWLKKNRFWTWQVKRSYPRLDAVVCLNKDEEKIFSSFSRALVIPNFIRKNATSDLQHDSKLILSVAGLIHRKGIDMMLTVAKKVLSEHPNWTWKLIGDGEMKEQVMEFIAREKLENRFILQAPAGPDISNEYTNAALFVLTSRYEAFPMVLLEAMTFGLPCISFDCPSGPADIIIQNKTGLLAENENIAQLADAINTLIDDEKKRSELGRNSFEAVDQFSPDNIYKRWEELFNAQRGG